MIPFRLTTAQRERLVREIAENLDIALWIVRKSTRTDAQLVTLLRDSPHCQYHKHILSQLRPLHDIHHTRGRLPSNDQPEYCIGLCFECHRRVENALGAPMNDELIALLAELTTPESNPLP